MYKRQGLQSVEGDLYLGDNDALPGLDGLESLRQVGGDLSVVNNLTLTSVDALEALDRVGGDLTVNGNLMLPTRDAETLASWVDEIGGDVLIARNGP